MQRGFVLLLLWCLGMDLSCAAERVILKSGGSRVFENVMYVWRQEYKAHAHIEISYDPSGSGSGIIQLEKGEFDFAVTDLPLMQEQVQKGNLIQFPIALTGLTVVVNLRHVNGLKLSGAVLADIYLGKITKWNDATIVALNPQEKLPDLEILPIHRTDPAGSTKYFTAYLSKANRYWQQAIGAEVVVSWPRGEGAKGRESLAQLISEKPGAIGYLDVVAANKNGLMMVSLENENGQFIMPSAVFTTSLSSQFSLYKKLESGHHESEWPIIMPFYGLISKDAHHLTDIFNFFKWSLREGDDAAKKLGYLPVDTAIEESVLTLLK